MHPWLWFFAPQIHYPFSGSVAQQIEPNLGWFFREIPAHAGDGPVEQRAFEVASYGKQLGLISEALLGLSGQSAVSPAQAHHALHRLEEIRLDIEAVKPKKRRPTVQQLTEQLERLKETQPAEFERLACLFR